jgi:hypothetical protein
MNINNTLLIDYLPFEVTPQMINESLEKNSGRLIVKGTLQRADSFNHNGRTYPKPILEREAARYLSQEVKERRALGELDHPDSSVINLNNVSHNILEIHWDGDDLVGTVEVLPTPSGNILKALFQAGIKLGISSRGLGSVKQIDEQGHVQVQDDFNLLCFDFVSSPSTQGAYLKPINEGVGQKNEINKYFPIEKIITDIISDFK